MWPFSTKDMGGTPLSYSGEQNKICLLEQKQKTPQASKHDNSMTTSSKTEHFHLVLAWNPFVDGCAKYISKTGFLSWKSFLGYRSHIDSDAQSCPRLQLNCLLFFSSQNHHVHKNGIFWPKSNNEKSKSAHIFRMGWLKSVSQSLAHYSTWIIREPLKKFCTTKINVSRRPREEEECRYTSSRKLGSFHRAKMASLPLGFRMRPG